MRAVEAVEALGKWANEYQAEIDDARARSARRAQPTEAVEFSRVGHAYDPYPVNRWRGCLRKSGCFGDSLRRRE